jgi:predicted DNA-binding transcriptional regulator YafY
MKKKSDRLARIIRLLAILQGGRCHNAQNLADACGVVKRTIFRDLDTLREAEVPLVYDEESQLYSIPSQFFLTPTQFTAEEALAVVLLCHELGDHSRLPFLSAARSAAVKMENTFPQSLRDRIRACAHAVNIRVGNMNPLEGQKEHYQQLMDAIATHRAVRVEYASYSERKVIITKLHPYRLFFHLHSWYVIGRSSMHRNVRMFNVGRIQSLEPLADKFRLPRGFSVERYLGNAWRLISEAGPDQHVVVKFSPLVARNVQEVQWHGTQNCELLPDGSLRFEVTVSGLQEISWWILGYGRHAEVLEPTRLRKMIADHVRQLAKVYADD